MWTEHLNKGPSEYWTSTICYSNGSVIQMSVIQILTNDLNASVLALCFRKLNSRRATNSSVTNWKQFPHLTAITIITWILDTQNMVSKKPIIYASDIQTGPLFRCHINTPPFNNWTVVDHWSTSPVFGWLQKLDLLQRSLMMVFKTHRATDRY